MRKAYVIAGLVLIAACDTGGMGSIAIAGGTSATHLVYGVPPTGSAAGVAITPAIVVRAALASGATDTSFRGIIAVALGGSGTGTLSGTPSAVASAGVVTFGDLKVSAAGTYTLAASSAPLIGITSSPFAITP